jgi:hypothetical protein
MAINYSIFDETAGISRNISVDFVGNILAASSGVDAGSTSYYFTISTSSRTTGNQPIQPELALGFDDLSLNGVKQRRTDVATPYTSVDDMLQDYLYDLVNGHSDDLHSSGVSERLPINF